MHVVFASDQHLESAGGAQVSMRLQRRFLERAGHTVTVLAPATTRAHPLDVAYVDLPSLPITLGGEYGASLAGARTDAVVDAALAGRPPVDLVHVQADFWGALIGYRLAARLRVPVVHTMHNRLDVGLAETLPAPGLAVRFFAAWQRRALGSGPRGTDAFAYLAGLARHASAVTAPSRHFARLLEERGVVPGSRGSDPATVDVVGNGIDDDLAREILDDLPSAPPASPRPRLVWLGRMSPEKRPLALLQAVALAELDVDVEVIGGGGMLARAEREVARLRPRASVTFVGQVSYRDALRRIAAADALVQTSVGFETQGMTVFEAAVLGTPAVISDPAIAAELGGGAWQPADASIEALAAALTQAVAAIRAGTPVRVDAAQSFLQSAATERMLAVYARVLGAPA